MSMMPYGPGEKEVPDQEPLPSMSWIDPFISVALLLAVIMAIVITCSGCLSQGCVAVIDLDLRTPDQIKAQQAADCAPFTGLAQVNPEQDTKTVPPSVVIAAIKAFFEAKGRYRIGYIAWGKTDNKETANETTSRVRR